MPRDWGVLSKAASAGAVEGRSWEPPGTETSSPRDLTDRRLSDAKIPLELPTRPRRILDGLGDPDQESAELLGYMMFERSYTREPVAPGYQDAAKRADELEAFLAV